MKRMKGLAVPLLALGSFLSTPQVLNAGEPEPGRKVFEAKCSICHGKDGNPKEAAGKAHRFKDGAWQSTITQADIEKIIAEGREREDKKMPPFREKLTPDEIKAAAAYVKGLGRSKK